MKFGTDHEPGLPDRTAAVLAIIESKAPAKPASRSRAKDGRSLRLYKTTK